MELTLDGKVRTPSMPKRQPTAVDRPTPASPSPRSPQPVARFVIKGKSGYAIVRALDITWVESAANYVVIHTREGTHVLRRTLAEFEDSLDPRQFFRTSRSTIVNLDVMREIQLGRKKVAILLIDGTSVPLTRNLRELQRCLETVGHDVDVR